MRIPTFYQFKRQADMITIQFNKMNKLFLQGSTGQKIQASSENPVLANQIKSNKETIEALDNFSNNGLLAQNRSRLFSTAMENSINILGDVKILMSKASNGTVSNSDKASIAEQLQGDLTMLLSYANTHDADGNYIFSGFNTQTPPYVLVNGSYEYQGGLNTAVIDISPDVSALYYESGFNVFGDIFNGNGSFTITAGANTGGAFTSAGNVVNPANYVQDTYTLSFVTNSSGGLAYQIIGSASGQVIPPLPSNIPDDAALYHPKSDITFNGINFTMEGNPEVGDTFTIASSKQENIFNAIQTLITTLQTPSTNQGNFNQTMGQLNASFSQITNHLITYQSQIGTRSLAIDNEIAENETVKTNNEITLKGLAEADPVQVYSALAQKSLALQATQDSYSKLQETLLQLLRLS
jgi:flagellar hook-associated protein 3 FlgL